MHASARKIALLALEKFRRNGAWSEDALSSLIQKYKPEPRDAALAVRICYTTLQNMALCDFYIRTYSSIAPEKLEPSVLDILRISVVQILFFTQVPDHAVVNEAVSLCRERKANRAAGLVNAVLRRLTEQQDELKSMAEALGDAQLDIQYSHPKWLADLYVQTLGLSEAKALMQAQNQAVPITIQVNTLKISPSMLRDMLEKDGIKVQEHPWLSDSLVLEHAGALMQHTAFLDGFFYVQDTAARLSIIASGAAPDMQVLDICAAPGGKSFAAGIQMQNEGHILSCDLNEKKLPRIRAGAERLGLSLIDTKAMDGRCYAKELECTFDLVLTDVPCSGLGVIRKKPEIRYKDPNAFVTLPEIQGEILKTAARYVRPGGVLLYSTCTIRPEENVQVIEQFLETEEAFVAESFILPGVSKEISSGMITLWPHIHNTDGFFICKMRRK